MKRLAFGALTLLLLVSVPACERIEPATLPPASPKLSSIPFTTNSDGLLIVPALLGGTMPLHVIFDTGAGLDVFAPSLVERLHGKPAGQFSAFRMSGERLDIPLFVIPELSIGPMVKRDVVVGTWDVLERFHRDGIIDGIISVNNFRQQPFTLDFIHGVVVFESPQTLMRRRALGRYSALQVHDQRGIALDLFAQFLIGNHSGQCEIDTGSPRGTVSTRYMGPLGIEIDDEDVRKHEVGSTGAAARTRHEITLPQISLAASPQITLGHARVSFADIIYDCVVGIDFWSGKVVTIDIARRQLIVSGPPPTY